MSFLSQVPGLKYALGLGGMMSFYGIVGIIVWMLPTEKWGYGTTEKIVVIALILLTMPIALILGYLATRRKNKSVAERTESEREAAEQQSRSGLSKNAKPAGNYDEITQAAEETVQFLKSSNLGSGKDAVYELPWYLLMGIPKSGKSSLALASALNFQTLPSQRQSEQKFIRPTRNVDWRVTSDAVFLDTAGRYQLEGADQDEWAGLLETLKKYRGKRPLDGMIVSVSAERILHSDEKSIEESAKVLRTRIDEVMQRTKIRFPIYLVFTHADSIEGFRDSFSTSQKEGENLVWGATIPLEKSESAHSLFDTEFELLQNSVLKRRLMRLSSPFPPIRQLKIFNFPLHFGSARKKLGHFVSNLFRPNPFSESPFLRGFYFTAVPVNRARSDSGQTSAGIGQTVGNSYFTRKLFRDVILRDKDLVASFQSQKVRPPIMGWVLTFLGIILVSAFLLGAGISLYKNKVLVENASRDARIVLDMVQGEQNRSPLDKKPAEAEEEIRKIEALRTSLAEIDKYEREWAPLYKWFGLYSGGRIYREKLLPVYYNAIEQRFKKPIIKKIESDLQNFSTSNSGSNPTTANQQELDVLDKNFTLFSAYLMLSKEQVNPNLPDLGSYRDHAEPTTLYETLQPYLLTESKVPEGMIETANEQLKFYLQQVTREDFPGIKLETKLVDDTRKKLEAYPAWAKYYKRVTTEISQKIPAVNADTVLAGKGSGQSFLTANHTVPGAYTIDGYQKYMIEAVEKAPQELNKDDWVMGGKGKKDNNDPEAVRNIQKRYFNDYINNWKKFVTGVNIASYKSKDDIINALTLFSEGNSPLRILLEEVSRQTHLSAQPASPSWSDYLRNLFGSRQKVEKEKTEVEQQFEALIKFTESRDNKPSQLSDYGDEFQTILKCSQPSDCNIDNLELTEITNQVQSQQGGFFNTLGKTKKNVESLLGNFSKGTVGPDIAALLRKPLNNLDDLVGGGIKEEIKKSWAEVLAKSQNAEKGYPFTLEGDADITELTKYLNPVNGTLTEFYNRRLKKYFEGEPANLKFKPNSEVQFSDDFLKYLNNAFRLREALFGKDGATPSFSYELKLQKINEGLIEVKIDGQTVDTNATGSVNFKFPSQSGETGAFMNYSSTAEPTLSRVPAANTSANSSSPNVSNSNNAPRGSQNSNTAPAGSAKRSFPGTWGLFRFVQDGNPKIEAGGEYTLTYNLGGKKITAVIKPTGGDLFNLTYFSTVRAPQNILR